MPSKTLKQRVENLMVYGDFYGTPMTEWDPLILRIFVEEGRDLVWMNVVPEEVTRYFTAHTIVNNTVLPDRFVAFDMKADNGANPGSWIPVSRIPLSKRNQQLEATASRPVFWVGDGKTYTWPSATSLDGFVIKFPNDLSAPTVDPTETDDMREKDEPYIARAAYERALVYMQTMQVKLKLTTEQLEHIRRTHESIAAEIFLGQAINQQIMYRLPQ